MLLSPSADQAFFRETTEKFLRANVPSSEIRRLRDDPVGFDRDYWRRGADLGWTSLLVTEAHGGGTISGGGLVDLSLVAYEFGRHAAPGPLIPTNVVAATLSANGNESHTDVLGTLLTGTTVASWCPPAQLAADGVGPGLARCGGRHGVEIRLEGSEVVLNGVVRTVESALGADHLLVTGAMIDQVAGRVDRRPTQVLVPAHTPGVAVVPMRTVDLSRRFGTVTFDNARVSRDALVRGPGEAHEDVARQLQITLALLCAEAVGTMQAAFDMTVEWAFDRYSFGRPLASYQALKHRFADMATWLEASHAISDAAVVAADAQAANADELASAAKAFIGEYGTALLQDCVQIHGGIGVTFEHDLHLLLRRFTVDRAVFGTPADHRRRIAEIVDQRGDAA